MQFQIEVPWNSAQIPDAIIDWICLGIGQLWPLTCSESLAVVLSWRRGRQLKIIKKNLKKIQMRHNGRCCCNGFFCMVCSNLASFLGDLHGLSGFWDYFCLNLWWFACFHKTRPSDSQRYRLRQIIPKYFIVLWDGLDPLLITVPIFIVLLVLNFSD